MIKNKIEIDLIQKACNITDKGFRRVLNFVTLSNSLREARKKGSSLIKKLNWNNGFFRKDIGWRAIKKK